MPLTIPNHRPRRRSHAPGFTLVELMVTILIVLVSLAFVIPRRSLGKAAQTKTVNSMRQVAQTNAEYSTENLGNINTLRWVGDPKDGRPYVGNSYWGRFQPDLFTGVATNNQGTLKSGINQELDQLFATPDADSMRKTVLDGSTIYHDGSGLAVPIAFNSRLYQRNKEVKVTQFGDAANVLYVAHGFGLFDEADGQEYVERPTDGSTPQNGGPSQGHRLLPRWAGEADLATDSSPAIRVSCQSGGSTDAACRRAGSKLSRLTAGLRPRPGVEAI